MVEKLLLGVAATSCAGLLAGQLVLAAELSDGLAVVAVAALSACLVRPSTRGRVKPRA